MELGSFTTSISYPLLFGGIALGWLLYRLSQVLKLPVDSLVKILGLEVPLSPHIALFDLTATSVTVHWKTAENHSKDLHFEVKVNGEHAGDLPHQENAATISGLLPGKYYTLRIVAVNSGAFSASSDSIQVRLPLQSDTPGNARSRSNSALHDAHSIGTSGAPIITPFKALHENISASVAPPLSRGSSEQHHTPKQDACSRRSSHASHTKSRTPTREGEDSEGIEALTTHLDSLRVHLAELQLQDEQEEAEFQTSQAELVEERDDLKRQLKDRDDQTKDLNKSVKNLEHQNSHAQTKKAQHEKILNDKLRARQRMQEEITRWAGEMTGLDNEAEDLKRQQEDVVADTEKRVAEIRAEQNPDIEALASIEEQIQQKGKEMQKLDEEKKNLDEEPDQPEVTERNHTMAVEEREWNERISTLQAQLYEASTGLTHVRTYYQQLQQQLDMFNSARRGSIPNGFTPPASVDYDQNVPEAPSSQTLQNARMNFNRPENRNGQAYAHNRNDTSSTSSFRTSSPFFTQGSSLSLPTRAINESASTEQVVETLTGGAMVSPGANNLLPSDLLGGDDTDEMVKPRLRHKSSQSNSRPASRMSRPLSTSFGRPSNHNDYDNDSLPGLGTAPGLDSSNQANGPNSPTASFGSGPPSTFSSPRDSLSNLHSHRSSDPHIENDRRSIRSASGSSRILPSSWRPWGTGRQRGNTASDEGPSLGSLKSSQSQSMPRETSDHPTSFGSRGLFGFGRKPTVTNPAADFGAIGSPLKGNSSRPESTYSSDNPLPAPSENAAPFGWGENGVRRSNSTRTGLMNTWLPMTSREPSVPDNSLRALRRGGDELNEEDALSEDDEKTKHTGSKRGKASDKSTSLNPNARDFTTMFGFGKRGDKLDKAGSKARKRDKNAIREDTEVNSDYTNDSSPPASRKSRDTQPNSFTESFEDIAEEPEIGPSTPADNASNKGSLMRRITSKGSTTKFLGLKPKKPAEEADEDSGSSKLGQSVDSITSNPTPTAAPEKRTSTSSFFSSIGRRKKKADEAPSVSETSLASDNGDEDDGRQSMDGRSM